MRTGIPDSRAKTCTGRVPCVAGTDVCTQQQKRPVHPPHDRHTHPGPVPGYYTYLIGNQLPKVFDRDPLTLALSLDGVSFKVVVAVRAGAPHARYPGIGKGPGFQYAMRARVCVPVCAHATCMRTHALCARVPYARCTCTLTQLPA